MRLNPLTYFKKHDLSNASPEFTQEGLKDYNQSRPLGPQKKVCWAPFKSLYFGHYGKAIACCYNRTYILGNYPEQSIDEIWRGQQAENLRKYISNNNLDHGCQGCKSQILARNFDATKAKQYDQVKLNRNGYPSVMEFELSNVCNLECEMCSGDFSSLIRQNREGKPPLEEPYDEAFVEQLEEFIPHLEEVKFYGGEPFLIDIYYQIWEKIIEINPTVRISVQTNGTILNNR
ncbi:MAG: SPASM domain-containing protein, partial [Flavobacteriales bacterium]|nr:SPASM domain-containing protein [Flavobacteriales bacterium]